MPAVVVMVHALAAYERGADQCHRTEEQLTAALSGPGPVQGWVSDRLGGTP